MNCVSCDIPVCVDHLGLWLFFPGVFLSSRVTGACPVTTDLIMRVSVRTTTTISLGLVQFLPPICGRRLADLDSSRVLIVIIYMLMPFYDCCRGPIDGSHLDMIHCMMT